MKHAQKRRKWRGVYSLRAIRSKLDRVAVASSDGAYVTIDVGFALTLIEVADQALHTEIGHAGGSHASAS